MFLLSFIHTHIYIYIWHFSNLIQFYFKLRFYYILIFQFQLILFLELLTFLSLQVVRFSLPKANNYIAKKFGGMGMIRYLRGR